MKTWMIVVGLLVVLLVAGAGAALGIFLTRANLPLAYGGYMPAYGGHHMHDYDRTPLRPGAYSSEPMHETMMEVLAQGLDLSVETLEARLQDGETLPAIAESQGLTDDALDELWSQARVAAIEAAVEQGMMSEEWAEFMFERMEQGAMPGGPSTMWGGRWLGRYAGCWGSKY